MIRWLVSLHEASNGIDQVMKESQLQVHVYPGWQYIEWQSTSHFSIASSSATGMCCRLVGGRIPEKWCKSIVIRRLGA